MENDISPRCKKKWSLNTEDCCNSGAAEEVRHASRNADQRAPFCIGAMAKKGHAESALIFVMHVVPPLLKQNCGDW